jgi:hypothetical protein
MHYYGRVIEAIPVDNRQYQREKSQSPSNTAEAKGYGEAAQVFAFL